MWETTKGYEALPTDQLKLFVAVADKFLSDMRTIEYPIESTFAQELKKNQEVYYHVTKDDPLNKFTGRTGYTDFNLFDVWTPRQKIWRLSKLTGHLMDASTKPPRTSDGEIILEAMLNYAYILIMKGDTKIQSLLLACFPEFRPTGDNRRDFFGLTRDLYEYQLMGCLHQCAVSDASLLG